MSTPSLQQVSDVGASTENRISLVNVGTSLSTAGRVGIANLNPIHTLDVGANVFIQDTASNALVVRGNVAASFFKGDGSLLYNVVTISNLQSVSTHGNATTQTVQFLNASTALVTSSNMGVANVSPIHTLDVGANLFVQDTASNVLVVMGNVSATSFSGDGSQLTNLPVGASNLQQVVSVSNITDKTVTFSNATVAFTVNSSAEVGVNLEQLHNVSNVTAITEQILVYNGAQWNADYNDHQTVFVKNTSGGTLLAGRPVHITGATGTNTFNVSYARANSYSTMPATGILPATLADNATGVMNTYGKTYGVDTSHVLEGETIYLSNILGEYSNVPPLSPTDIIQRLGVCVKSHPSTGVLFISNPSVVKEVPNSLQTSSSNAAYVYVSNTGASTDFLKIPKAELLSYSNLQTICLSGNTTTASITANRYFGDGGFLSNISAGGASNLQQVLTAGNVTTLTMNLANLTTSLMVAGNVSVSGNVNFVNATSLFVGTSKSRQNASAISITLGSLNNQGSQAVAIGFNAGQSAQGPQAVAIGPGAGMSFQIAHAVAIGLNAGTTSQAFGAICVGTAAAGNSQGPYGIAIGYFAGDSSQSPYAVALGRSAGASYQNTAAIAIGFNAGLSYQNTGAIAIGTNAGANYQHANSIIISAIGSNLNSLTSNAFYVKPIRKVATLASNVLTYTPDGEIIDNDGMRFAANSLTVFGNVTATRFIGDGSLLTNVSSGGGSSNLTSSPVYMVMTQNTVALKIGSGAYTTPGNYAIAIGQEAGSNIQGESTVAIGQFAGQTNQGKNAVAIGFQAGQLSQGVNSIAIGANVATISALPANTICINSTGLTFNPTASNAFYVKPIRNIGAAVANVLLYSSFTGEIGYSNKTFVIPHPKKDDNYLVHACLEGPEVGVYYRGKNEINQDFATITLPDYVPSLIMDVGTVQITPIFNGKIRTLNATEYNRATNSFEVHGEKGRFYWCFTAKRLDLEIEPKRDTVDLHANGPYTYLTPKR